jgi:hypothetical protein
VEHFLKMLIHHVDHSITESTQSKKQDEEEKREQDVLPVFSDKHACFGGLVGVHFGGTLGN